MTQPTVSVIVPAYNCANFLGAAIESVRSQTFKDLELIVVDDGSTDNTLELARQVAATWLAMRVIHIEHAGLARARNVAIEQMNGQWVALLDGDDVWEPGKLQACMEYLGANPRLSVVYHPMVPISSQGRILKGRDKRCSQGHLTESLFHHIYIHDPSAVIHKRVFETVGPFDQSLPVCVGHEFWLRVSTKFEIGLVRQPLARRRCHESSLTRRNRARSNRVKVEMLERFYFERGGKEIIKDRRRAMCRLAKVRYRAARYLIQQRAYVEAAEYLAKAIRLYPLFLKSYPYWLFARMVTMAKKNSRKIMGE